MRLRAQLLSGQSCGLIRNNIQAVSVQGPYSGAHVETDNREREGKDHAGQSLSVL